MGSELLSLLISWMPFIALIIVWVWLSRLMGMRSRSPSGTTLLELTE